MVMTEPIDLWVDPLLRQLLHEQKKVWEMQDTELAAYVLDSKDKMPPRKPFPHDHKDPAAHKNLRWHVGEVIEDLMAFNKLATKAEAKTMRAVSMRYGCKGRTYERIWAQVGIVPCPRSHARHVH